MNKDIEIFRQALLHYIDIHKNSYLNDKDRPKRIMFCFNGIGIIYLSPGKIDNALILQKDPESFFDYYSELVKTSKINTDFFVKNISPEQFIFFYVYFFNYFSNAQKGKLFQHVMNSFIFADFQLANMDFDSYKKLEVLRKNYLMSVFEKCFYDNLKSKINLYMVIPRECNDFNHCQIWTLNKKIAIERSCHLLLNENFFKIYCDFCSINIKNFLPKLCYIKVHRNDILSFYYARQRCLVNIKKYIPDIKTKNIDLKQ